MNKKIKEKGLMSVIKDKKSKLNVFYADFETVIHKEKHYITCFSIVDSKSNVVSVKTIKYKKYNIENESASLLNDFIEICMSIPVKDKCFYFHNFVKFDMYFILSELTKNQLIKIDLLSRNKVYYSLTITDLVKSEKIIFRDSYLILPLSLKEISKNYCVEHKKTEFNHINNYNDYSDSNFIKNIEEYCVCDSLCLSEGIGLFRSEIKELFSVDCFNTLTISSLSLRIFRSKYYEPTSTPIYSADERKDEFIRKSYRGGLTNLFVPVIEGECYHYDINSLYPSIMGSCKLPINNPTFVKGKDIILESFYGFIECEVCAPYSKRPFLSIYDNLLGLITPIGIFGGIFFSEELIYAKSLGYQINIKCGYSYDSKVIFHKFVDDMYKLRLNKGKQSSIGGTVKLLMNSLYGRFGMKLENFTTKIVEHDEFLRLTKIYNIETYDELNEKILISYSSVPCPEKIENMFFDGLMSENDYNKLKNIKYQFSLNSTTSIAIASAITGFSRIKMHRLMETCDKVYYSDTDSIFTNTKISEGVSPTDIGMLKLEGKILKGYFASAKSYAIIYDTGIKVVKSKGFDKTKVRFNDYMRIYETEKDKKIKYMNNFFKNKKQFEIIRKYKYYTFRSNANKRVKIFNKGKWVDTDPIIVCHK